MHIDVLFAVADLKAYFSNLKNVSPRSWAVGKFGVGKAVHFKLCSFVTEQYFFACVCYVHEEQNIRSFFCALDWLFGENQDYICDNLTTFVKIKTTFVTAGLPLHALH